MRNVAKVIGVVVIAIMMSACAGTKAQKEEAVSTEALVTLTTQFGEVKMILFDDTPIHKNNFLAHAMEGKYDGSIFHRVIDNFMIQGGAFPNENQAAYDSLTFEEKTLAPEFHAHHKHNRGAVAAARTNNPQKRSDDRQFYIVQNHRGAHHLDMGYSVFGQVVYGMDVVDKIAKAPKSGSKPKQDITMKIRVDIVTKEDILKYYGDIYAKYNIPTNTVK